MTAVFETKFCCYGLPVTLGACSVKGRPTCQRRNHLHKKNLFKSQLQSKDREISETTLIVACLTFLGQNFVIRSPQTILVACETKGGPLFQSRKLTQKISTQNHFQRKDREISKICSFSHGCYFHIEFSLL